jgi:hypothetical protein
MHRSTDAVRKTRLGGAAALMIVMTALTGCSKHVIEPIAPSPLAVTSSIPVDPTSSAEAACAGHDTAVQVSGTGFVLKATVQICVVAPVGTQYWLVAEPGDGGSTVASHYPKGEVKRSTVGPAPMTVILGKDTTPNSYRQFYVVRVPLSGVGWMQDALAHDGDGNWDGNRLTLPTGSAIVSNHFSSHHS